MKASGKIGSNGVQVSKNVEKRFETDIYIHTYIHTYLRQDNATAHTTNFSALEVPLNQVLSHSVYGLVEPYI